MFCYRVYVWWHWHFLNQIIRGLKRSLYSQGRPVRFPPLGQTFSVNKRKIMTNITTCYLCDNEASVEVAKGEGGQRFDVLCTEKCPRYIITCLAINYLNNHPAHRKAAIENIKLIAKTDKLPLLRTSGIPKQLHCTSCEAETAGA